MDSFSSYHSSFDDLRHYEEADLLQQAIFEERMLAPMSYQTGNETRSNSFGFWDNNLENNLNYYVVSDFSLSDSIRNLMAIRRVARTLDDDFEIPEENLIYKI